MAKEKLSREQNEALRGSYYPAKSFELLAEWLDKKEISKALYNTTIDRIVHKEMRKTKPCVNVVKEANCRCVEEGNIQHLTERLRSKLKRYLAYHNKLEAKLDAEDIMLFKKLVENNFYFRPKIDRLLILALRYPDKELNKVAEQLIIKYKRNPNNWKYETNFWILLWSDDFVPRNAPSLMIDRTEDGETLFNFVSPSLARVLLPLIKWQIDSQTLRFLAAHAIKHEEWHSKEINDIFSRTDAYWKLYNLIRKEAKS